MAKGLITDPEEQAWNHRLTDKGRKPLEQEFSAGDDLETILSNEKLLQYPSNLGYDPELQNYVLFEIYDTSGQAIANEKSAIGNAGDNEKFLGGNSISDFREGLNETATSSAEKFGGSKSAIDSLGTAINETALDFINIFRPNALGGLNSNQKDLNLAKSGRGNVSYNAAKLGFSNRARPVGTSIALPLPAQLNASYGFEYEEVDFSGLMFLIEAKDALIDGSNNKDIGTQSAELMRKLGKIPSDIIDSVSSIVGSEGAQLESALAMRTRQAANQFKEQVFKGVGRRTFSFEWSLSPRSQKDVIKIYSIVHAFKKYSHPSRTNGSLYLNFPGEFKIGFFNKIDLNDFLFRIGMCACTKCEVTYGGDELMFFRDFERVTDPNIRGAPANVIKLSLEFTELELLTRERIQQGY